MDGWNTSIPLRWAIFMSSTLAVSERWQKDLKKKQFKKTLQKTKTRKKKQKKQLRRRKFFLFSSEMCLGLRI